MTNIDKVIDFLVDREFFTIDEIQLITCMNGHNIETLNDAMYVRYGMHNIDQLKEEYCL